MAPGPAGIVLSGCVPLPRGGFARLAAARPRLRQLACRMLEAWCEPGRPGFGVLELNGGWRAASLDALAAAIHTPPPPCPGRPALLERWCERQAPAAEPKRAPDVPPAESSSASADEAGGDARLRRLAKRPARVPPLAPAPACRSLCGGSASSGWSASASGCSASTSGCSSDFTSGGDSISDSAAEDDEEVCSAPKRPRLEHGSAPSSGMASSGREAAAPGTPGATAAAAQAHPPQQLPAFSPEELELLWDLLHRPAPCCAPGAAGEAAAHSGREAATAVSSPRSP